ncbi:MAG: DUF433 domain-containing protein, partial [Planctomycetes bacterium]|nr:DUF433 domain-containing protein [Planctomycetota bacterium]
MNEQWRSRITIEPGKCGGRPCIRGMRITVYDVMLYLLTNALKSKVRRETAQLLRRRKESVRDAVECEQWRRGVH